MRRWYFANHSTVLIFHNFSLKFSLRNLLTIFEFYAQHYIGRTRLIGMHSPFGSILTDIDNIWRGTETIFGTDVFTFYMNIFDKFWKNSMTVSLQILKPFLRRAVLTE